MFKLVLGKAEEPEIKLPTSVGSQKKQESSKKTNADENVEKLKLIYIVNRYPPCKTFCQFLRKLNRELSCDPAIPLIETYPRKMKTMSTLKLVHEGFGFIHNSKLPQLILLHMLAR